MVTQGYIPHSTCCGEWSTPQPYPRVCVVGYSLMTLYAPEFLPMELHWPALRVRAPLIDTMDSPTLGMCIKASRFDTPLKD